METHFEVSVPVLVIGGGAAGCVAALAAHDAGADVLLVEQDAHPRGTTAMSQGLMAAAGTRAQAEAGIHDSGDILLADILAKTRGQTDPVLARAIAFGSGPTIDWLTERHRLPLALDLGFRPAYGNSTFRVHGWPGHNGEDLINLLHQRLAETGIPVLTEARLTGLIADRTGTVAGVTLTRRDGSEERLGCSALVLACGGFAANREMVAAHMPEAAHARHNGHEGNRGDAIRLGAALGAATADMGSYQGYAMLTDPHGITMPPGVIIEGGLLLNARGERFIDETEDIAGMMHAVLAQPGAMAWVLADTRIERACATIPELAALIALNAARTADTLPELASRLALDAPSLEATLAHAHHAQASNQPDRFGRRWGSDRPPLPPYRAWRVTGALYHTQGGLQIDAHARVLRPDGTALPNLFAAGGSARGVSGPSSWGYLPAMGLCAAVTTGRLAGEAAAGLVANRPICPDNG